MPATNGIGEEIVDYLAANGVGTKGVDIFFENLPSDSSVNNSITVAVYIDGGFPTIESGTIISMQVSVIVRADQTTYAAGRAKAITIYNLLHNKKDFLAESTVSLSKAVQYPPIEFKDFEENWNFSLAFAFTAKEAV